MPRDRLAFVLKLLGVALLPLASLALAIAIVRTVTRGEGSIGYDLLTAGTALVPVGLLMPAAALLGPANIEVVLFLSLVCLCLTVLVLNSAFTRIIRLSDRGAILAVPATLLITFWLSKVVVMSVVLG